LSTPEGKKFVDREMDSTCHKVSCGS